MQTETDIEISLLMSTRNRAAALNKSLEAIAGIKFSNWELIVVDNGSTDNTEDVVRAHQAKSAFPIVYVREDKPGLSHGRNAGLAASRGQIIAYTDDDCYPEPDSLKNCQDF